MTALKMSPGNLMQRLPGPCTPRWPAGERFVAVFARPGVSVELYAPVRVDPQTAHTRDEVYFIVAGSGEFVSGDTRTCFKPGDALFVAAGVEHRFENFTADFITWVVFHGPEGGERIEVS